MSICSVPFRTDLTASVIRGAGSLEEFAPRWAELFRRSGCHNVFLSAEWMGEWWSRYGNGHSLFIIALQDATGDLVGVAPFFIGRARRGRWTGLGLRFLASEWVCSDHLDLLAAPGLEIPVAREAARVIVAHRHEWQYIEFADYDADSVTMGELRIALVRAGLRVRTVARGVCPYIPLPGSFNTYLTGLSPIWRYAFRRALRSAQRRGALCHRILTEYAEIREYFPAFMRLHRLRFEQRGERSAFLDDGVLDFHRAVLARIAPLGWARLDILEAGGNPVAAYYGFCVRSRFFVMQTGFDPVWARLGLGNVMVGLAIQESIRCRHSEFDFLRGNEPYKSHWAKHARETVNVKLFDRSAVGFLLFAACSISTTWARTRHALRLCLEALLALNRLRRVHAPVSPGNFRPDGRSRWELS